MAVAEVLPTVDWAAEARRIGLRLQGCARDAGGAAVWLKPVQPNHQGKPITLGPHLYAGASGVALFLAALGHVDDDEGCRDLARRALAPLRRQLAKLVADPAAAGRAQLKPGGLVGLGAFLYTFVRAGTWLDEAALIAEACDVATLITPELIERDTGLDVMYGVAGALLALLLLDREAPDPLRRQAEPLARAEACGDALLRRSVPAGGGSRGWPAGGKPPRTGFAHGAAGIGHALARLAERTGWDDYHRAALEGFAFERLCYDPGTRNWRVSEGRDAVMVAWCNGAPGIALGRLGTLAGGDGPELRGEVLTALETARHAPPALRDFVCCGTMGRADVLLKAHRKLGQADLLEGALEVAGGVVERAGGRGGVYRWAKHEDDRLSPAFFTGAAGIGYSLLRLSGEDLPCVLALE